MGCNMCLMQKPDESYQVTIQVDSEETSRCPQNQDPPVLWAGSRRQGFRRKEGIASGGDTALVIDCVDSETQTELSFQNNLHGSRSPLPPVPKSCLLSQQSLLDDVYYDSTDYLNISQHEVDPQEYEEMELCKSHQQVKLGLPLCYRTDEEKDGNVYTGGNEEDDFELQQDVLSNGLQLPHPYYNTRVGRPGIQRTILQNQTLRIRSLSNSQDVDSGVGRTDESTRNDESSEHDLLADDITSLGTKDALNTPGSMRMQHRLNITSSLLANNETAKEKSESERFCECVHYKNSSKLYEDSKKELMVEGETHQLDLKERRLKDDRKVIAANHLRLSENNESPGCEKSDKESAYNTGGESCRSIGNECHLSPFSAGDSSVSATLGSQTFKPFFPGARRKSEDSRNPTTKMHNGKKCIDSVQRSTQANWLPPGGGVEECYHHCGLKTSEQFQICINSKVQQAMAECSVAPSSVMFSASTPSLMSALSQRPKTISDISKQRPIRDRLLRARAVQISEERSGMTTDEDAISEMKAGRYWSKEERRQQLLRAREQKKRRELMMQSRLDFLREKEKEQDSILKLSQRRSMKRRNRRILDNWITIQELLAHGTRTGDGQKVFNPLLSVTTV